MPFEKKEPNWDLWDKPLEDDEKRIERYPGDGVNINRAKYQTKILLELGIFGTRRQPNGNIGLNAISQKASAILQAMPESEITNRVHDLKTREISLFDWVKKYEYILGEGKEKENGSYKS